MVSDKFEQVSSIQNAKLVEDIRGKTKKPAQIVETNQKKLRS